MNRFFSLFLMAFTAFFVLQAAEVTFDFSTAEGITAMGYAVPDQSAGTNLTQAGPVTVNGVTLTATNGSTETRIWNSQGSYTLRIYVDGSVTFSVAEGSITAVTVNALWVVAMSVKDALYRFDEYTALALVDRSCGHCRLGLATIRTIDRQTASVVFVQPYLYRHDFAFLRLRSTASVNNERCTEQRVKTLLTFLHIVFYRDSRS